MGILDWLDPSSDEVAFRSKVLQELRAIKSDLARIQGLSPEKLEELAMDVKQRFAELTKKVEDQTRVTDGAVMLMDGMTMVIQDLKEKLSQGTLTEEDFVAAEGALDSNKQKLSEAVVRNTPSEQ